MVAGSNVSKISKRSSLFGINHFDRLINCPITSVMYFPVQSIYPDKQHFIGKHNPRKWLWCPQPQEPIILPWIIHNINLFGTLPPYTHIINAIKLVPEHHAGLGPTKKNHHCHHQKPFFITALVDWLLDGRPADRNEIVVCVASLTLLRCSAAARSVMTVPFAISFQPATQQPWHNTEQRFCVPAWSYLVGGGMG